MCRPSDVSSTFRDAMRDRSRRARPTDEVPGPSTMRIRTTDGICRWFVGFPESTRTTSSRRRRSTATAGGRSRRRSPARRPRPREGRSAKWNPSGRGLPNPRASHRASRRRARWPRRAPRIAIPSEDPVASASTPVAIRRLSSSGRAARRLLRKHPNAWLRWRSRDPRGRHPPWGSPRRLHRRRPRLRGGFPPSPGRFRAYHLRGRKTPGSERWLPKGGAPGILLRHPLPPRISHFRGPTTARFGSRPLPLPR